MMLISNPFVPMAKHILAVRQISLMAHTVAVLIFESNLAFESQHLMHSLEENKIRRWVSLSEGQQQTLGWLTTNERKEQDCTHLKQPVTFLWLTLPW